MESKSSTSKHGDSHKHSGDAPRGVSNHGSRLNGDGGHSGGHNGGHNGDVAHGYMVNTGLKTDPSNGVDVNASNVEDNGDKGPSRLDGEHNGTPNGSKLPTRSLCVSHESAGAHHDSNALKLVSQPKEAKGREAHVCAGIDLKFSSCEDAPLNPETSLFKGSFHGVPSHLGAAGKSQEESRVSQAKEGDKEEKSQLSHSGNPKATFLKANEGITTSGSCKSDEGLLISGKNSNQLSKDSKTCYSQVYPRVALGTSTNDQRIIEGHLLVPKRGNREEDSIDGTLAAHGKAIEESSHVEDLSNFHAVEHLKEASKDVVHSSLEGKKDWATIVKGKSGSSM